MKPPAGARLPGGEEPFAVGMGLPGGEDPGAGRVESPTGGAGLGGEE